jgi:hypothetical protein
MARGTDDPAAFVLALAHLGFQAHTDKRKVVQAWNRAHPEKPLPIPRKE